MESITETGFMYGLGDIGGVTHLEVWIGVWIGILFICMPTLAPFYPEYVSPIISKLLKSSAKHTGHKQLNESHHTTGSSESPEFKRKKFNRLDDEILLEVKEGQTGGRTEATVSSSSTRNLHLKGWNSNPNSIGKSAQGSSYSYYGQSTEQPKKVFVFVQWESIDHRKRYMSLPDYESHLASLKSSIDFDDRHTVLHVPFESSDDPSPALGRHEKVGVTEIVFFHFPPTLGDRTAIMKSVDTMRPVVQRSEALAVYDGWALEEKRTEKGDHGKIFVNVVGWVDVDAHMRFQASEGFKQNIHHLMGLEDLQRLEMHHAKLHAVEGPEKYRE